MSNNFVRCRKTNGNAVNIMVLKDVVQIFAVGLPNGSSVVDYLPDCLKNFLFKQKVMSKPR